MQVIRKHSVGLLKDKESISRFNRIFNLIGDCQVIAFQL